MSFFNQYSAVFTIFIIGLIPIGLLVYRAPVKRRFAALIGGVALLVTVMVLFLRPDSRAVNAAEVEQVLAGNGRLALIELYSDY